MGEVEFIWTIGFRESNSMTGPVGSGVSKLTVIDLSSTDGLSVEDSWKRLDLSYYLHLEFENSLASESCKAFHVYPTMFGI